MARRSLFERLYWNGLLAFLPYQFAPVIWVILMMVAICSGLGVISFINQSPSVGLWCLVCAGALVFVFFLLKRRAPGLFTDEIPD